MVTENPKKRTRLKIGDCFVIPLPSGRYAYGQYVHFDQPPDGLGYLVQIFDLITDQELTVDSLRGAKGLFPPVFVWLQAAIRSGRWKLIGSLPVEDFQHPKFRQTNGYKPGVYCDWEIWDGKSQKWLGKLPPKLRSLELYCLWGEEVLEERIDTGVNEFDELH